MIGVVRGVLTLILMVCFIALTAWAWSGRRKAQFESMARVPLEDEPDAASGGKQP
jgi:cytochrome c oxidase cbb3-type subunit 4